MDRLMNLSRELNVHYNVLLELFNRLVDNGFDMDEAVDEIRKYFSNKEGE